MATVRTVDFLPDIFRTPVNKQFLSATLDQLVQEPKFKKSQGFIGRRVGPGVNANDHYVLEPTKSRNDYQLEPGVIQIDPTDATKIVDAITYPGLTDALQVQGGITNNSNYLYTSEYYSWDPFVDFDKFVNYAQYFWLPGGPLAVDVSATGVPATDNFTVTRANGVYTFSGQSGSNPTLTLVKGGNYTFNVAQNTTESIEYRVTNNGTSAYVINFENNPSLTLVRGNTYVFNLSLTDTLPFFIKTIASLGLVNIYSNGVINNGASDGLITFIVPQDAPDILYYCNPVEFNLRGQLNIVDATAGTGNNFWIQTDPGVNGRIPATPNIGSRDVLGVINNGIDLGTITFNVPLSDAQSFYYNLNVLPLNNGTVDLLTTLQFDQVNNVPVAEFIATYGGIDGITNLNGRSLIFTNQTDAGWDFNNLPTGFDSDPYSYADPITDPALRYSVWFIQYNLVDDVEYIQLTSIQQIADLTKFTILFGSQWASTQWYKDASGYFEAIPLLTAARNLLWYQDGTDPNIFGQIRLIDQTAASVLDIATIIGQKNYTSPNGVVFTNGMKVLFRGNVVPAAYQNNEYYVEGVGTAIKLLPTTNFVTPELYITDEYTAIESDSTLNGPLVPDYITINRASLDLNPWTRSNRWFHIDIINAAASYNNTIPVLDNNLRARRPVLEFRAGTRLYNFGTEGKQPVNIIDFTQTDALRTVNGSIGFGTDGYTLIEGSRIIFAADVDPVVRRTIYEVVFITPDTVPPLIPEPIISLIPTTDSPTLVDQSVLCLNGNTLQGQSFKYDGINWTQEQQKLNVNQPPQFDIYDTDGISFGDHAKYPSTNFTGSSLFSYAVGSGPKDLYLGFPLTYLSLTNIGDIVFDNNLYADSFNYTINNAGQTVLLSSGVVRQYSTRLLFDKEIGWQTGITKSQIRQQFQFVYDGTPILLDVAVNANTAIPAVQIFINATFQESYNYRITTTDNTTRITWLTAYVPGDLIEIDVLSDQVSNNGFFQVPINLENNPLNNNSKQFTLGTVRNHYSTIAQNLIPLQGPVIGANNTRDLGNLIPYGLQILQQSSPLTLAGYFMRDPNYNIFASLDFNSREYIKFKSLLLNTVINNDYGTMTIPEILDSAIAQITVGKTNLSPFYWSDMLPTGTTFVSNSTTVSAITTPTFNTVQTYSFTESNYLGLLVYVNNILLVRNYDYTVSADSPVLTITVPLNVGDIVTINEYSNTVGSFVPNTPTKLGLYPKFKPEIFYDPNYLNPNLVIQGHDGSITLSFGDFRDEILLEFEKRIYDNLKNDGNPVPLVSEEVIPGFFRTTDYTQAQITQILGESFLTWVGQNKLDYKTQNYIASNPFTYNYSVSGNKLNEEPMLGAWRGIYRYFYDTTSPNLTPWEMLGFSEQPVWWATRYGPVPYTSDNLVLWGDLEAGYVADPVAPYINPRYARPGLTTVIPVDSQGVLLSPLESIVGQYNPNAWRKSWVVGDGGPTEASWWSSSSYPFAVMRLLALTRPAEFFSLFVDRDLYKYNTEFNQYLYNGRYRINANEIQVYGNGVSKASYINWIIDYNQQLGINSSTALTQDLANLDVRLCYRMAAFTDKKYANIYLEKSSPESQNASLLLPPESWNLLLYANQPFNQVVYSSLIIEQLESGFSVYGYSNVQPYFPIVVSTINGITQTVSAGGISVVVPAQYTSNIVNIPYGYNFSNSTIVVDFILSYGVYLNKSGLIFDAVQNGYTLNWSQMAQEFLYWSQQGWAPGTIINLNPGATKITAYRPGAVVAAITSITPENMLTDQNKQSIKSRDLIIQRYGDSFVISSATNQTISYLDLKFTNYENMAVLDNVSIFNDLIYDTTTAERQNRIEWKASISSEWDGTLNAQGFILNQNNVIQWQPNVKYTKGEIVIYKNNYWSALNIVQPSTTFEYASWVKSNYAMIDPGLLPNIANKADQQANSYNIYDANLARDNDLLAYGLIGFRPRQYMVDLNLDDVSQIQIYQDFIASKGTRLSAELFTRANLNKETGQYNIYENWGVLVGTYGANANRSWFEISLNQSLLSGNPSTIQIIQPGESSQANQTIYLSNLWSESYAIPTTNILPTTYGVNLDTALPSAGYVNLNDVDITVFNLNDPTNIDANIGTLGAGTVIWVAQINSYDWGIYKCVQVSGRMTILTNNLNATSVVQFTSTHGRAVGDIIIIKYFNDAVNGVYRVLSVPSPSTLVIAFNFTNTAQTQLIGDGLVFYLQSMRVSQASDVVNLPYATSLVPGATAWVDNDGSGHWEVLQKTAPFTITDILQPYALYNNSLFGTSISQTTDHYSVIVGSPGAESGAGAIYTYRRAELVPYITNVLLTLNATGTAGYGNSVMFGNLNWAIAGASASNSNAGYATTLYQVPGTNSYVQTQLLVAPDQNFGSTQFGFATAISLDERWMYISAPGANAVYAYGRVDIPAQTVTYLTNGTTTAFNWADSIMIDPAYPNQLVVIVNNLVAVYGIDYYINSNSVQFYSAPATGQSLIITRKQVAQIDHAIYYNVEQNTTSGIGTGAIFTVANTRGSYNPTLINGGTDYAISDTLTISYTQICPNGNSSNDLVITVTAVTDGVISAFTFAGSGISTNNGFALVDYLYTVSDIYSFTVRVNGILQRPHIDYDFNSDSSIDSGLLEFNTIPPAGADIEVVADTYWQYINSISVNGLAADALFGASIATSTDGRQLIVGAPNDLAADIQHAGSVYVYDRSVVSYQITNTAQTTYIIPGEYADPVAVLLNNVYLTNTAQYINGQFTISGSNIVLSSDVTLSIGDILTIETNQFQQIEKLVGKIPEQAALFGYATTICSNSCSIYIGAPFSNKSGTPQSGLVERQVNQSRIYGVTTSTVANPVLTAGDTIRVNNIEIVVPPGPNNNIAGVVAAINNANVPNAVAALLPDVKFVGNGTTKIYDIGSIYSAADSYTTVVYVDSVLQTNGVDYTYNNATQQILFVSAPAAKSAITIASGRMTVSVINAKSALPFNKLSVLPGLASSAFDAIGFNTYIWVQDILSPNPTDYGHFGSSISVNTGAVNLVVGAPKGNVYEQEIFDGGETYFDERSTTFFNPIINSGVVYTYDYLPSATTSASNPGYFVFGQQVYNNKLINGDQFGTAVNYVSGRLIVGAPGSDTETIINYGESYIFDNPTNLPAWQVQYYQQPVVDTNLLTTVYSYDKLLNSTQTYYDFIDPLQGKILGAARQNINYIGAVDPATYNQGSIHNVGTSWGSAHVGEIWWDTNRVRFIDPNQDDIVYASKRWGQVFPGSNVDIYQWIESSSVPASYTGVGTPLSTISYTVETTVNKNGIFVTNYYFWVRGISIINTAVGKTLSTTGIANYILNPIGSGIPYIAGLNSSTIAIYNAGSLLSAQDTILHVGYDRQATTADVHVEYEFIPDGRPDGFLNANLYRKFLDSFCGTTLTGSPVPDPMLSPGQQYGVQFSPQQSMFANRFMALQNYLTRANTVLAQYPISETRSFNLLNSSEPKPAPNTGAWNFEVPNLEVLGYQNLAQVPLGYLYLVDSDSSQHGLWTIYVVAQGNPGQRVLDLVRIQNYDTPMYWTYINWYRPGYNSSTQIVATVTNYAGLSTLSLVSTPVGSSVKVSTNSQGKFEIYLRTATGWDRVGLQDGTVEFSATLWNYALGPYGFDAEVFDAQYFDQEPVIETRQIIRALNEELYINELLIERNQSLVLMFNFIYSEFTAPNWLMKTSYVDVDHTLRALLPYQLYQSDNQTFVENYIQEVKPYHTQILNFNLIYDGMDTYAGMLTDYDVPAYYKTDIDFPQFVSPILTPYTSSNSVAESFVSDAASNAAIWMKFPWNQWFSNYLLEIQDVIVVTGGTGYSYTNPPTVTVSGTCVTQATMTATVNSLGQVTSINIIDPGAGYSTTAQITLTSDTGSGAIIVAQMGNGLVRSFRTVIKYDRYQYQTSIVEWQPNIIYTEGTQVRYANVVWSAIGTQSSTTFIPSEWTKVDAASLSGVNRTMGFYTPGPNQPGLSLPLLINGVEYPGVQVLGLNYNQNTGFDIGNFDINPFDNFFIGPEGLPTYDPAILDTLYGSSYLDLYLGTRPTDINVSGDAYISPYSSHAPEELVPGAEFDTLDFRVYTTPGADWRGVGHGFPFVGKRYTYNPANPVEYFGDLLPFPMVVLAWNITTGLGVEPSAYDWVNYNFTLTQGASAGDIIQIAVVATGGGNQLMSDTYIGSDIGNTIIIPFNYSAISEFVIYNGEFGPLVQNVDYTYSVYNQNNTVITFTQTYGSSDRINLTCLGYAGTGPTYSWSLPIFQSFFIENSTILSYTLTNSLQGTNPVNIVVTRNGVRARPSNSVRYITNGLQTIYDLPITDGVNQELITDNDVSVYLDNQVLIQNVDYVVDPFDISSLRTITLAVPAPYGNTLLVAVRTAAQYWVVGDQLIFQPSAGLSPQVGDFIEVITWNDTSEQRLLTQVWVGPTTEGVYVGEGFDTTNYDPLFIPQAMFTSNPPVPLTATTLQADHEYQINAPGTTDFTLIGAPDNNTGTIFLATGPGTGTGNAFEIVYTRDPNTSTYNNMPGAYDYSATVPVLTNKFDIGTIILNPERLLVTLNGNWLFNGEGYTTDGSNIIINGPPISASSVVAVTSFAQISVPAAMAFRIFQDMRGVQATYRITSTTTTTLVQPVSITDDIIYVNDAAALIEPNLVDNVWGALTIDGERIMYRVRNINNNTVSSLLRGTAGTAAASHTSGAIVYNIGPGNLLPAEYQDYIVANKTLGDGTTTTFVADNIDVGSLDSTTMEEAVQVYIGGTLQTSGYIITADNPVIVEFDTAPPANVEVDILIRRGVTWYAPGINSASNGRPLQETNTKAARFLRGL